MTAPIVDRTGWLLLRVSTPGVSASDFAKLITAPLSLWSIKKGLLPPSSFDEGEEPEYMKLGREFESGILRYAARREKLELLDFALLGNRTTFEGIIEASGARVVCWMRDDNGAIQPMIERRGVLATLDGVVRDHERQCWGVIESKNRSAWFAKDFGGTLDEIPRPTWLQLAAQLYVTDFEFALFAAVVGGTKCVTMRAPRESFSFGEIEALAAWFAESLKGDVPPEPLGSDADEDALRAIYPGESGETVALDADAESEWAEYAALGKQATEIEKKRELLKQRIHARIGEASFATFPGGLRLSRKWQERAAYQVAASRFPVVRVAKQEKTK